MNALPDLVPMVAGSGETTALVDAATGYSLDYAELERAVDERAAALGGRPGLAFAFLDNDIASVVDLLGARAAGHAVALLDPGLPDDLRGALLDRYRPGLLLGRVDDTDGWTTVDERTRTRDDGPAVHADLAILLTTSGSTGSPKFVRLSAGNIAANADAIATSLDIGAEDRAFAALPLHYSFGMSVLTSHLARGATVVLTGASVIEPVFWEQFTTHGATSLAGVPYSYQMLHRTGFLDRDLPTLRTMTQAGGRLADRFQKAFAEALEPRGVRFHVMYGQTEAAPRISCMPAGAAVERLGSVGRPLPGVEVSIENAAEDGSGEVVVRGPNVMMGYAEGPDDLARGDETEALHTGDLGRIDEDGFLWITGRSKRIGKVFGVRVSLDEVESMVATESPELGRVAVTALDDQLAIHHEPRDDEVVRAARSALATRLKVPVQALRSMPHDELPTLASGKPDYRTLQEGTR